MRKAPAVGLVQVAVLCCVVGCGTGELKSLSSVECTPHAPTDVTASDYDAAGRVVALGYGDGCFELRRGSAATRSCGAHRMGISNLVFSPDGAVLATGDTSGNIALSHVAEGKSELLTNLASAIRGLAFNPTATLLAATVENDVVLLDRSGRIAARASLRDTAAAVTFAHNGTELIAAGAQLTFLSVPDLERLNSVAIREATSQQNAAYAMDVRVSPDGQMVGILLTPGVAFFDRRTEQLTLATLDWRPLGLRFAPDGRVALFARDRLYVGAVDPQGFNPNTAAVAEKLADVEFQRDGTVLFVR